MSTIFSSSIAQHFERKLAGHTVAHKLSGSGLENERVRSEVLRGIRELMRHDVQCLLVSGAGSSLSRAMGEKLFHPRSHLRITRPEDIGHVEAAITNIGETFSEHCDVLGIPHEVLPHSVTQATRLPRHGRTGSIVDVNREEIQKVLSSGKLAVLPFGGVDSAGNTLNVNADEVAARSAAAVEAMKLILYTNEEGIMRPNGNGKWKKINFLDFEGLTNLLREQDADGNFIIDSGMWPKVKAILQALAYGVPQVHVVQAKTEALLEELFTRTGSGTVIEKEPFHILDFPARREQLGDIQQLRKECASDMTPSGVPFLKPLSYTELERLLPTTLLLRHREVPVGTVYFDEVTDQPDTAIIGGFAVGENHQNSGYGRMLLESALEQVGDAGYRQAISMTAADPVKGLFAQYGKEDGDTFGKALVAAKERYGEDENLLSLYSFEMA